MALPDLGRPSVQFARFGPGLCAGLEDGRAQAETHGAPHVRFGDFGHEDDDRVRGCGVEFA